MSDDPIIEKSTRYSKDMEWQDDGIIIRTRPYSDRQLITTLITRQHGKHAGILRMGAKKNGNPYQIGTFVQAHWHARLAEHLGLFRLDVSAVMAAHFLHDPLRLQLLQCASTLIDEALPEHDPHALVFECFSHFIHKLAEPDALKNYVSFELKLLEYLGFGLNLTCCAATGETGDLAFISPKSGHAVSQSAGAPYRKQLFKLPLFFMSPLSQSDDQDIHHGLTITGYFLEKHLFHPHQKQLPSCRHRLKQTATVV